MAQTVNHIKGNINFVLIHSGIVNGYQLLCDTPTVLQPPRGTAAFFYFTHYHPFPLFLFMCFSLLTVLFLGALLIVFWFPNRTSVCRDTWHHSASMILMCPQRLNDLNVSIALKALLNWHFLHASVKTYLHTSVVQNWLFSVGKAVKTFYNPNWMDCKL